MPVTRLQTPIAAVLAAILVIVLAGVAGAQAPADEFLITPGSVGPAVLGSTPEELASQLGDDFDLGDETRITVDFDGFAITRDGEVQFRAAMADRGEQLNLFIISNPAYATAEGVGAGMAIGDAEGIYGEATLSWNPDNESREFVTFADQPEGRISFRTPGIGGNNVGVYADGEFETTEYDPDAVIAAVWISCVPGTDCPADLTPGEGTGEGSGEGTGEGSGEGTGEGSGEGTDPGGMLADTGAEQVVLLAAVTGFFMVGGALVRIETHYGLAPAWLSRRR